MRRLLPAGLALALKQVLSLCPIPLLPPLLSGGDMLINSTSGRTINPSKQWVITINGFVIRVSNCPSPLLCTLYHEPIVGVIYHIFGQIAVEISLVLCYPSDALIFQLSIDNNHRKNR